jgi:hypothetical protein
LTEDEAPDTARVYERAKPEAEAGMGKLRGIKPRKARSRDKMLDASSNPHQSRQLNSEDGMNRAGGPVQLASGRKRKTRTEVAAEKRQVRKRAKH